MLCFAVWSVMPVTVILIVGAEAVGVSARDGQLVPGGDSIAEAATLRTPPGHLTRPDGREETLAALRFRWPVYGPISSDFDAPRASRTGFHAGVDIGASRGTFVRASAGGTVAFVGWRSGYGRTIVLDADKIQRGDHMPSARLPWAVNCEALVDRRCRDLGRRHPR